jgi:hypothetical protein
VRRTGRYKEKEIRFITEYPGLEDGYLILWKPGTNPSRDEAENM